MRLNESHGQYKQDFFVANFCDKKDGFFLDIGCYDPIIWSNTYSLEVELNWRGILIDIDKNYIEKQINVRSCNNSYIIADLEKEDINNILEKNNCPNHIDFISFDVDDANLNVIQTFDFNKYSFTFATFEHDLYRLGDNLKKISKKIFLDNGYKIYRENLVASGNGSNAYFEDWWIKR